MNKYKSYDGMKYPNFIERVLLNTLSPERFCGYVEHYMVHNFYKDLEYHAHPIKRKDGTAIEANCWGKLS